MKYALNGDPLFLLCEFSLFSMSPQTDLMGLTSAAVEADEVFLGTPEAAEVGAEEVSMKEKGFPTRSLPTTACLRRASHSYLEAGLSALRMSLSWSFRMGWPGTADDKQIISENESEFDPFRLIVLKSCLDVALSDPRSSTTQLVMSMAPR